MNFSFSTGFLSYTTKRSYSCFIHISSDMACVSAEFWLTFHSHSLKSLQACPHLLESLEDEWNRYGRAWVELRTRTQCTHPERFSYKIFNTMWESKFPLGTALITSQEEPRYAKVYSSPRGVTIKPQNVILPGIFDNFSMLSTNFIVSCRNEAQAV